MSILKISDLTVKESNINIDEYIKFREFVKSKMEYPKWLGDFSREDLFFMLNHNSKIWIYYLENEPICSMMLIPSDEKPINDFGLKLDYRKVVDYGPMFVNPKYVGNGLQYQMLKELDNFCINNGYKYAISTVHPDNTYSINNLLKDDFIISGQKSFRRGIRNIYLKCLDEKYVQKILTFIVNNNKHLLLKGSDKDPQFHESFWYVVTGSKEKEDNSLEDIVKREVKEETNLELVKIEKIPLTFEYESLGKTCIEYAFISYTNDKEVILNEESTEYKWCDIEEFIELIKWYDSKEELKDILVKYQ